MQMWTVKATGVVSWSQGKRTLVAGQTIAEGHPLRTERPDLFELRDVTPDITHDVPPPVASEPPVERGTRAPGERRAAVATVRRPRGSDAA